MDGAKEWGGGEGLLKSDGADAVLLSRQSTIYNCISVYMSASGMDMLILD